MHDSIPLELQKLGLKDKEVKVYLAGLELGPSPVQNIARKAGLVRPTVHEILKSLIKKELFSETIANKRRLLVAQSPERILQLLRIQKRQLEEQEREFIRIVAALESRYYLGERGGISVFHGQEGLRQLEEKISFASMPEILVFGSRVPEQEMDWRKRVQEKIRSRLGKLEVKELYAENMGSSSAKFAVPGTLVLFDQAVFIPAESAKGYLIENQIVVELLRFFFRALWKQTH